MHQQELHIQVQGNRFLTFQSMTGSSSDQVVLPLSPLNIHTCYYKLHSGYSITQEDKKFASISWEVLNILKENFPSKIYLSQDNLEQCRPEYIPMTPAEELRRQISCLMSIKEEGRYLTTDELEDAWHALQQAEKLNDQRSLSICLEIIQCQTQNWSSAKNIIEIETLQRIMNKNDYTSLSSNKMMAGEIVEKIDNAGNNENNHLDIGNISKQFAGLKCEDTLSLGGSGTFDYNSTNQQTLNFEKPTSTRMCLFQLSESNDINRITMILETLSLKSKETIQQLRKKYNLNHKMNTVLKKYCNAEYGFDQISSRQGSFQKNMLTLYVIMTSDYVVFLDCLQSQTLDYLSQLIEEAIIFSYEDAIQGSIQSSNHVSNQAQQFITTTQTLNYDLFKFLNQSLDFIELAISKQFQEFLPTIRENMRKVQARMIKLFQKKENHLLNYFIQNITQNGKLDHQKLKEVQIPDSLNTTEMAMSNDQGLSVQQLTELRELSEGLYNFAVDLNHKIQKIDALVDSQEDYEDKYQRIFFRYAAPSMNQLYDKKNNAEQIDNSKSHQTKVKFDVKPLKPQQLRAQKENFSTNVPQTSDYYTSNVFVKNQYDEQPETHTSFKRPQTQQLQPQRLPPARSNINKTRDNESHFIGSPIEPQQQKAHYEKYYTGRDSWDKFS